MWKHKTPIFLPPTKVFRAVMCQHVRQLSEGHRGAEIPTKLVVRRSCQGIEVSSRIGCGSKPRRPQAGPFIPEIVYQRASPTAIYLENSCSELSNIKKQLSSPHKQLHILEGVALPNVWKATRFSKICSLNANSSSSSTTYRSEAISHFKGLSWINQGMDLISSRCGSKPEASFLWMLTTPF